ncbi:hypothetical protein PMJ11TS3_45520 [Paenibacillus melissococcoides]
MRRAKLLLQSNQLRKGNELMKQQGSEGIHLEPGAIVVIGEKEKAAQDERPVLLGSTYTICLQ